MHIRRLKVANYRGIKTLDWILPLNERLICLIGPGDSGKSSVLEAMHLLLGDKWNPSLADTDFHAGDATEPVVIRAIVADLPVSLLKESAFGLWLSGVNSAGDASQDPIDGFDPCVIVQVKIDQSLEPIWTIERLNGGSKTLTSSLKREFATFKVDDRTDIHLRWTRNSALGRMKTGGDGVKNAVALASRAANRAIAGFQDDDLDALVSSVQDHANKVGGRFVGMHPGLDTSQSPTSGNLALYEGTVPVSGFGLGSKRLAGIAIQQMAAGTRSILLADELEHGLEPHRLVQLLQYLHSNAAYSQIFITTHSPIAVEQATTNSLAIVRNDDGVCVVHAIASQPGDLALRLRRSRPSSFLARKILVVEGKTEHGLVLELIEHWDELRQTRGLSSAAGEGTVVQDGQGGSEVPLRADALRALGYEVAAFADNDDRTVDAAFAATALAGTSVLRWELGNNTERQVAGGLDVAGVTSLLQLAADVRNDDATVLQDLKRSGLPASVTTLRVSDWLDGHVADLNTAREIIAITSVSSSWFKQVDPGRKLGRWIVENESRFIGSALESMLKDIEQFIYPAEIQAPSEPDA